MCLNDIQKNDRFAAIYDEYYERVYKYAYTLLLNRENAEDVTSDTFLSAYMNFGSFNAEKGTLGAWLTRIAHNRAVNLMRSSAYARRADLTDELVIPDTSDFTGHTEASETVLRLYALLSPEERELLNMRCVMELKDKEIAGISACVRRRSTSVTGGFWQNAASCWQTSYRRKQVYS